MSIIYFVIVFISCTVGAISGIGGGIIIKPVIDSMKTMPLVTINFLSSSSVLTMAMFSVLQNYCSKFFARKSISNDKENIKLNMSITLPLAVGSSLGGFSASYLFDILREYLNNDNTLAIIQSSLLLSMIVFILLFCIFKSKIKTHNIASSFLSLIIGFFLSLPSSFLGLGGGPMNIAILYYFYSMNAKTSAINSLFIIFFSQSVSLTTTILSEKVPEFSVGILIAMCIGAVIGAFSGRIISKKIDGRVVERVFIYILVLLVGLNIYNLVSYLAV